MKSQIKLNIPTPCQQNWQQMAASGLGKYCQVCTKTVTDFTEFTDAQLIAYFKKNQGKVCGRFTEKQLTSYTFSSRKIPKVSRAFTLLLSGLLGITSYQAYGQPNSPAIDTIQISQQPTDASQQSEAPLPLPPDNYKIIGQLADSTNGQPLPGVSVHIKGTNQGTQTDKDGNFELTLNHKPNKPVVLVFQSIGYENIEQEVITAQGNTTNIGKISMEVSMIMGDIVVHRSPISRLWWKLRYALGI